jgi:type III restriction enzyme
MASDPQPVQPVPSPIICSPYREPEQHWFYHRNTGEPELRDGRRPAAYWYKEEKRVRAAAQEALPGLASTGQETDETQRELDLVNKLRKDVKRWRASQYSGAENMTKELLRHWWRKDRARRLFFCQLEAAETIIFLCEMRGMKPDGSRRRPLWTPEFTDADFEALVDRSSAGYDPLVRMCAKVCTGAGKTTVMAMLIAWSFCNRARVPSDERFPNAALVCCPNLTIKERLQVLRPDSSGEDIYAQFELLPTKYRPLLQMGKVAIVNWHLFNPASEHSEGGRSSAVVNKGPESDEAFAVNRLDDLYPLGPLLVINDEGHHAYRPKPLTEAERERLTASEIEEREEATRWVTGLDRINRECGVRICLDLSATPFYIKGSGYPEGEPFPWIVSDFGLVDGIESGITKIPRLPVSDTTGRPDPKYFRLWKNVAAELAPAQRVAGGRPKPEVVWERAEDALQQLAGEYANRFEEIQAASDLQDKAPPVMILVCDNTKIAELFFRKISGEEEVEIVEGEEPEEDLESPDEAPAARSKKPKKKTIYRGGSVFPALLENGPGCRRTISIDSSRLAKVESEEPGATRDRAAQQLRDIVNSVGKTGKPGQDVRCVVSVAMLTEGWDANNVTHILGLRAFGSQLLCEQVVGRGLRRMNYDADATTELLPEEYVDVYGIPFSVIPYKGKSSKMTQDDRPLNSVHAVHERSQYEMRFPNVEGYVYALNRNLIRADVDEMERLELEPQSTPTATFLRIQAGYTEGTASGKGLGAFVEHNRAQYYSLFHLQQIEFEIARQVVSALVGEGEFAPIGKSARQRVYARHALFPQVARIVRKYVATRVNFRNENPCELGLDKYVRHIVERLLLGIQPDEQRGEPPLLPVLNRFDPISSTAQVRYTTKRPVHGTDRSHLNCVVLDSTWEQTAAFRLEQLRQVVPFYARNDREFLTIPYEFEGVPHSYSPDYLVRLADGTTLLLEIKGHSDDQTNQKHQAARRWVSAVNNWGQLGKWRFAVCRDVAQLETILRSYVTPAARGQHIVG